MECQNSDACELVDDGVRVQSEEKKHAAFRAESCVQHTPAERKWDLSGTGSTLRERSLAEGGAHRIGFWGCLVRPQGTIIHFPMVDASLFDEGAVEQPLPF